MQTSRILIKSRQIHQPCKQLWLSVLPRVFLTIVAASAIHGAEAGNSSGQVSQILVLNAEVVIFTAGPHQTKPPCSVINDEWAVSLTNQAGKAMYALLVLAYSQGKYVNVQGTQGCGAWSDRETPAYVQLLQQ